MQNMARPLARGRSARREEGLAELGMGQVAAWLAS